MGSRHYRVTTSHPVKHSRPQARIQVLPRLLCCQVGAASPGNEKVKPRTFIARVGAFAEESKTNYELRGILDVSEESFRELRHVGNPENWGDFAPHVAKNTADPKHSYPWYANYYAAKSPPSGTGTGARLVSEEKNEGSCPCGGY